MNDSALADPHSRPHQPLSRASRAEHLPLWAEVGFAGGGGGRPSNRDMPDVAERVPARARGRLDRVGMSGIEVPVQVLGPDGHVRVLPAVADAFVSLDDPHAKGIHMSRLFLALQDALERDVIGFDTLERTVDRFLASHRGLSGTAEVTVRFDWMRKRAALESDHAGWRTYPVSLKVTRAGDRSTCSLTTRVTYSSTCPCSAALARQLIQEAFDRDFGDDGAVVSGAEVRTWLGTSDAIRATPHSQRSHADLTVVVVDPSDPITIDGLIDRVEGALVTVVQAAVKREDEQAFALLNGQNPMFCEDAARRVKEVLDADGRIADYHVRVSHFESLHPHDAVSVVVKGVPDGLRP